MEKKLCEEMQHIHNLEIERAKAGDRTEPDWVNTIELFQQKGYEATEL